VAERITVPLLQQRKSEGQKITAVTAYDFTFAKLADEAEMDIILVGDSLGNVMLGYDSTLPVTMDDMIRHTRAVRRGVSRSLVVADLPFLSYQTSPDDAVRNAGRLLQEGGAAAVKLEGGTHMAETIRRLVSVGIPVMGHLGWTPQSINLFGRPTVQGRTRTEAQEILDDARALAEAGAFAVVLEVVPERLAALVTDTVLIPTIGIGAGPHCDGQVLVMHDLLGLGTDKTFRHAKRFANLNEIVRNAFQSYRDEVLNEEFPTLEHSFAMDEEQLEGIDRMD
jgi:3-methyl-2-oxobutanoate hydroxymethyltransferase